jgi:transposase-like protein
MKNKVELRYSDAFKQQVVKELESGVFDSPKAASRHYGIKGTTTVRGWLRRLGKDHLLRKLVRVEAVGEADRVVLLQKQVEQLERALGQSAAERLLAEQYLKLACGRLGEEVDAFKKKSDGRR